MQFTKLRLQGFKSFVDPTDLLIMEGLTGVVGPNGCGKSNLLEALRWVMGENRPTQMRGGGMEDVIFAGTDSRGAKHFAEVTLIIDNQQRIAPAAFNHSDELEVIRRITRDIGSAYKLNGKDVRARDVSMMFADAATGSHSPSLVRQGQISELINAKPQARRRVLEDAAGISGLYQRRHEAELKLNSAETNLLRVDDTLDQLASQIRSLERQAKAAQRYKEIANDLRAAEAVLAYIEWKELSEKFIATERHVTDTRLKRSESERVRRECEAALIKAQEALPSLRDEEAIAAALLQRLNIALTQLSEEQTRASQAIADLSRAADILSRDKTREEQIANDASEALKRLEWEENQLQEAAGGEDEAIQAAHHEATSAHEVLTKTEEVFDDMRQELAREEARAQAAERRYNDAKSQLEKAEAAGANARSELELTQNALKQARLDLEAKAKQVTDSEAAIEGFNRDAKNADELQTQTQGEFDRTRAQQAERAGELSALHAERKGLVAVLNKDADGEPMIDAIEVATGFEAALGAALDHELDLPQNEDGTGWRQGEDLRAEAWPQNVVSIAPHIQAPDVLKRRLAYIGVTDEVTAAMISALKPGQRLVTKSGDLYRWDGLVKLARDGDSAAALRLQQRNRLKEIDAIIAEKEALQDQLTQALETLKAQLQTAREKSETAQKAARHAERALTEAIREQHMAENNLERLSSREDVNASAVSRFDDEAKVAREEQQQAMDARVAPEDLEDKKHRLEVHRTEVENARSQMLAKRARLDELRKERERRQSRLKDMTRERENWQKRLANTSSHQSELAERMRDNEIARKEAEAKPLELEQKRVLLESDIVNAERRMNAAKEALAAGESARAKADNAHREAEHALGNIRERLARFEAELEAASEDVEQIKTHIVNHYKHQPEDLGAAIQVDAAQLPSKDGAQDKINALIRQRESLGAVNLRAEEDRAEVVSEHEKLISDKAEISDAIAKLRQAIAALNKEGRERLLAAFDEVNANFTALFTKLFGGGTAKLELVESDDPLNAGLEILCQPPGKKLATLSLLSGGEQTLTALSLIFAVFLTNPSPICVLDEVDAPLDDANVTRFCNMLDEMVSQTQTRFLIITHHALTMSRMHRLFGVTMHEKGVSQLVSVDLTEAEKLVDA